MERMHNITRARLYVTTEKTYASGDLFGRWMEVSAYAGRNGFFAAFRQLYKGEDEPVLKLLDRQDVPGCLVSGNMISGKVFRLARLCSGYSGYRADAFYRWLEHNCDELKTLRSVEIVKRFELSYSGCFEKDEDFGRYHAKEQLGITDPAFDCTAYAKLLFETRFTRLGGYVFEKPGKT